MQKQIPRRPIVAAVAFSLSVFAVTLLFWKAFGGPTPLEAQGYRFHASFAQGANLYPNADVRISGVPVGKVVRVRSAEQRTDALIELEKRYAPIPRDAHTILRTKTLLGETFVELTPGHRQTGMLPDGGRLPTAQIGQTQQLDQVLGTFDRATRRSTKRFLIELSAALKERGQDLNDALGNGLPAAQNLRKLVDVLDEQQDAVNSIVREGGLALDGLGRRQADLQGVVTAGESVFSATAARNRDVTETVRELPPFLRELRVSLADFERKATQVAPTVSELRRLAPDLRESIVQSSLLAPRLEKLFHDLPPVMRAAGRGLPAASRMLRAAKPFVDVLYPASREIVPTFQLVDAYKREIATALAKGAAATQASLAQSDGSRLHYLRTLPPFLGEGLYGYAQREPTNRHNPYPRPGSLDDFLHGGLRAFDCRNTSNPQRAPLIGPNAGAPACLVQGPWSFQGHSRAFPHVERLSP